MAPAAKCAGTARRAAILLLSAILGICLNGASGAGVFQVGGNQGWVAQKDPNSQLYNQWAENNRFQIGDSLLFVYQAGDSVLQVSKDDYNSCNTASPIASFSDGRTKFTLDHSGPFYFLSGAQDHCGKNNQKLTVVVLSDRSKRAATNGGVSAAKMGGSLSILGALLGSSALLIAL